MTARLEKNGTYTSQFWYEEIYGKKRHKCKRGFATEEAADAFEEVFLRKARGSMEVKLADFVDVYLEDVKAELREYTLRTRLYIINDKIIPELDCKRMKDIETVDIIQWQNKMLSQRRPNGSPYSETYLRMINSALGAIFSHAAAYYDLSPNPMAKAPVRSRWRSLSSTGTCSPRATTRWPTPSISTRRVAMARRNDDRRRCVTVGFRVSKEQAERIDLLVALSGKTKQDYIVERLENESMEVIPSPRMQRTRRDEMRELCSQLELLKRGEEPSERLLATDRDRPVFPRASDLQEEVAAIDEQASDRWRSKSACHGGMMQTFALNLC